jgi:hypothetical protein
MGFNTTVVVLNDALHQIAEDPKFGETLADAISGLSLHHANDGRRPHVGAGFHANAATVIETHHADGLVAVAVGGNYGINLGYVGGYRTDPDTPDGKIAILKNLASNFGLKISIREK